MDASADSTDVIISTQDELQETVLLDQEIEGMELGEFGDDDLKELMEDLEGVVPDDDDDNEEAGPCRVTVQTDCSLETSNAYESVHNDDTSGNSQIAEVKQWCSDEQLSLLDSLCEASNQALVAHAEVIAARDALSIIKGATCFAPSTLVEEEDVNVVKEVASHLPFLFTHPEANGYLSCNISRRYACVGLARNLHPVCSALNSQCEASQSAHEDEESASSHLSVIV